MALLLQTARPGGRRAVLQAGTSGRQLQWGKIALGCDSRELCSNPSAVVPSAFAQAKFDRLGEGRRQSKLKAPRGTRVAVAKNKFW